MSNPAIVLLVLSPLIIWRSYARIRRMVGRQRLSAFRPWVTVCVFPFAVVLLLLISLAHASTVVSLLGGVIAGALLGVFGLKLTKFEYTPQGVFYTPNVHLGVLVSLLFIGRILYRFIMFPPGGAAMPLPSDFGRSPVTLLIFGTLAGYYVAYAIGLLRRRTESESDRA